ncbi:MAG: ComF family protein [Clostridia bacterium]|nr:ComF family protein [Clostridia bacterium]
MNIKDWFLKKTEAFRAARANVGYSCDVCGREVFAYPKTRVCEKCLSRISFNDGLTCPLCGRKTLAAGLCLACKSSPPAFDKGLSPLVYARGVSSIINRLKNGQRHLCYFIADECVRTLNAYMGTSLEEDPPVLIAVPMTKQKIEERGFNQAEEIAKAVAQKSGLSDLTGVLFKARETSPQKDLSAKERRENVSGAYRVKNREACKGKRVILIDDVMTTSATGNECAKVLKRAGAREVIFLTAASLKEQK